eukprot:jgi/Chlat1/4715/Chrsp30S04770
MAEHEAKEQQQEEQQEEKEQLTGASSQAEAKEAAFVHALDAVEELLDARRRLQDQLALGFMSLARARYSLGAGSLSQENYDYASMAATTATIRVSGGTGSSSAGVHEHEHAQSPSSPVFSVSSRRENAADSDSEGYELDEVAVQSAFGLRRRANVAGASDRASSSDLSDWEKVDLPQEKKILEDVKDVDGRPAVPPIRWFGVLVPPAMREAQQQFIKALELVAEAATAAARYQTSSGLYEELCGEDGERLPSAS